MTEIEPKKKKGCGCGGRPPKNTGPNKKTNISHSSKTPLPQLEVSEATVRRRRNSCRYCTFATRSKDPKHKSTKGLTSDSVCLKNGQNIAALTAAKETKCPIGNW